MQIIDYIEKVMESNITCDKIENMQNWTDIQIADELLYSTTETLLVTTIIPIVFFVGFLGNGAFIWLVIKVQTMRTMINFYLTNLAAADLLVLSVQLFYRSWRHRASVISRSEPFRTDFGCRMYFFADNVSSSASILFITLITLDRYFAICHPLKYHGMTRKTRSRIILTMFTWTISAILGLLSTTGFSRLEYICFIWPRMDKYKNFPNQAKECEPMTYSAFKNVSHIVRTTPFLVALITNTAFNIKIIQTFRRPCPGENGNRQRQPTKRRITWMLVANCVIFFCCLAPSHFLILQNVAVYFFNFPPLSPVIASNIFLLSFVLYMLNSAVNPILYLSAIPGYRREFIENFCFARNQNCFNKMLKTEATKD